MGNKSCGNRHRLTQVVAVVLRGMVGAQAVKSGVQGCCVSSSWNVAQKTGESALALAASLNEGSAIVADVKIQMLAVVSAATVRCLQQATSDAVAKGIGSGAKQRQRKSCKTIISLHLLGLPATHKAVELPQMGNMGLTRPSYGDRCVSL